MAKEAAAEVAKEAPLAEEPEAVGLRAEELVVVTGVVGKEAPTGAAACPATAASSHQEEQVAEVEAVAESGEVVSAAAMQVVEVRVQVDLAVEGSD